MKIGIKIRMLREFRGYSQDYMSIQLEISQATYSKIENEYTKIDISRLSFIAGILEIDLINLLLFDENNINDIVTNCSNHIQNSISNKFNPCEERVMQLEKKIELIQNAIITNNEN